MGSEINDIREQRAAIIREVARESNPEKRAEIMAKRDEPLRRQLQQKIDTNRPRHAQDRARAREALGRWQRTGSTFDK